jgi:hypothetical protein
MRTDHACNQVVSEIKIQIDSFGANPAPTIGQVPEQQKHPKVHMPQLEDREPGAQKPRSARCAGDQDGGELGPGGDARREITVEPCEPRWFTRCPCNPGADGCDLGGIIPGPQQILWTA